MIRSSTKIRSTKGSTRHTFFLPGRGMIDKAIRLYLDQFDDFHDGKPPLPSPAVVAENYDLQRLLGQVALSNQRGS
jgi:hypothetical protein